MCKIITTLFLCTVLTSTSLALNLCGEWTQYQSYKCVKALDFKATEEEALKNCTQLESTSSLVTIHSKEEQLFINQLLFKYNNISNNAWIAMKYRNASYEWLDGTATHFTNWAIDAVRDGTDPCVQMSIVKSTLGQWTDESCKKTALVVCQKKPVLSLNLLRESIEKLERKVESIIPLGFLYTQLPEQSSPQKLWPDMSWNEVTPEYAGLFFRAEGNNSLPFGEVQQGNQSWISNINGHQDQNRYEPSGNTIPMNLTEGAWSTVKLSRYALGNFDFFTTAGEVRPKNTAIRIWKRIE